MQFQFHIKNQTDRQTDETEIEITVFKKIVGTLLGNSQKEQGKEGNRKLWKSRVEEKDGKVVKLP